MSPCSSVTLAASTALKLPKALVMPCASSSMVRSCCGGLLAQFPGLGAPLDGSRDKVENAAGLKARDQYDDGAIDHEGEASPLAAEPAVGELFQRHQDRGAHQRPEQQPCPAERGHDQHFYRDQNAEAGFR